jgi:hypothetical protein
MSGSKVITERLAKSINDGELSASRALFELGKLTEHLELALKKIVEDRSHVDPFALEIYTDILTECRVPFEHTYNGGLRLKVGE